MMFSGGGGDGGIILRRRFFKGELELVFFFRVPAGEGCD